MAKKSKSDLVREWTEKNNVCGDNPWFDNSNTYYNLRIDQIIKIATYISKHSAKKEQEVKP